MAALLAAFAACIFASLSHADEGKRYTIGVLAHRGGDVAIEMWQPTANYLTKQIPGAIFHIEPMELFETRHAAAQKSIDFLFTNPGNFVEIDELFGLRGLASLKNLRAGKPYTTFGAVIFTRADRDDINALADLKGKTFMGVKQSGFGGFQMAWRELLHAGVDPFKDFAALQFSGFPQDGVAYAVRDGLVDAGTFRTDSLERMAKEGKINVDEFKILNARDIPGFPFAISTPLYPEWSIAALSHVDDDLATKVQQALLAVDPQSPEAKAGKSTGWSAPLRYTDVRNLLTELGVDPFNKEREITLQAIWEKYRIESLVTLALLLSLTIVTLYVVPVNRRLDHAKSALEVEVSERKKIELELLEHRGKLEEMVRSKTDDLRRAHNAALEASKAKSQFLANTSHELRTPLNAIIGYSEMLLESLSGSIPDAEEHDLEKVLSSGKHLLELINALLDLSKIEAGKVDLYLTNTGVNELVKSVIETIYPLAEQHSDRVETDLPSREIIILTDQTKLRQVLINLMSNACKFTTEGVIQVKVEETVRDAQPWIIISIRDNGIGMSRQQREKLFEPFAQADRTIGRRYGGTGLGLAISRGFCELMGGNIEVQSTPDVGSTFIVSLPKYPEVVEAGSTLPHDNAAAEPA